MKTLKDTIKFIKNQEPIVRFYLIIITALAAVSLVAMVVNFIYYGI